MTNVLDDLSPDAFAVDEDIVTEWFLQTYEQSDAYNMSIYKDELFKQFLSHFELHYSGENLELQRNNFIDQIHRCLEKNRSRFQLVATKVINSRSVYNL